MTVGRPRLGDPLAAGEPGGRGPADGIGDAIGDQLVGLHVRGSLSPYPTALRSDIVAR